MTEHNKKILDQLPAKYRTIFEEFVQMCEIPHGSYNQGPIVAHFKTWAEKRGYAVQVDAANNVLISVPATAGKENVPGVCLQGHTDMVCVKAPESNHDFAKDPLKLRIEDGWLYATGTTLGADNGMGDCIALTLATDKKVTHGPIEILLTSDEEVGLIGASALKTCLKSKYLLNLDSEDFGDITVSCAGGFRVTFEKEFQREKINDDEHVYTAHIHDYLGGHSGVEINQCRANAIKQMAKVFSMIPEEANPRIVSISGGTAHNAIPAFCKLTFVAKCCGDAMKHIQEIFKSVHQAYNSKEGKAAIELTEDKATECFSSADTKAIINILWNIPHGPQRFSQDVKDFVETSFATTVMETRGNLVHILGSGRSCFEQELDMLYMQCQALGALGGWKVSEMLNRYAGWPARMDSPLLKITEAVYKEHCDHVKVCAIHAGLEAGMICKVHEGMDAISIGPTILSPHSPQERCKIDTVGKTYEIVVALLERIAK